jgi:serine/threonine-protein kinase
MTEAAPDPLLGAVLAGRYRVLRKLGEGGMGAVYAAAHVGGGQFAVKVIHSDVTARMSTAIPRFLQEVRTASTVNSPNAVPVVDAGTDPERGVPFLVMPLLSGGDVEQLVERVGPLDPTTAVRIAIQAARGLGTAHAAGIVHRDMKPANLFLDTSPAGEVTVKVCDFGIAKVLDPREDSRLTRTGSMLGSPLYMSPEQAKSAKHVDGRTDVWSLGTTLYYMLTGTAPFAAAQSMAELIVSISTKDAPPLLQEAPWVDPSLAAIVHATLARDLERRIPSMHALFNALLPHAKGGEQLTAAMLVGPPEDLVQRTAPMGQAAAEAAQREAGSEDGLVGTTLAGKYRIHSLLGKGGMGAVYAASDASGQRVAVKVMFGAKSAAADGRQRFVREAKTSAAIESPHVVRVLDADTDPVQGVPFIVMELLSGMDLHALVDTVGAVDATTGVRLMLQACRGIGAAHRTGVVHRDIKPANLFLDVSPGGEVMVKVCDFGIAKITSTEAIDQTSGQLTKTGGMLGSPVYMSPEQAKNAKHVDARTDVWSLCMTMYEAFSGTNPWQHCTTLGELILAVCTEDVRPLAEVAPWLDQRIADAVQRGLRREVGERWASLDELAAALQPLAGGDERISREMLVGVSAERRSIVSPRMVSMPAIAASTAASGATAVTVASAPAPRRGAAGAAVGLVMGLAAAGVAAWLVLRPAPPAPVVAAATSAEATAASTASAEASAAPAVAPAPAKVKIAVRPASATVTVDGEARELEGGDLVLEGAPGSAFKVVAVTRTGRLEETVKILADGTAEPAALTVSARGAKQAGPAKAPGRNAPRLKTDWK